jgi:integrase
MPKKKIDLSKPDTLTPRKGPYWVKLEGLNYTHIGLEISPRNPDTRTWRIRVREPNQKPVETKIGSWSPEFLYKHAIVEAHEWLLENAMLNVEAEKMTVAGMLRANISWQARQVEAAESTERAKAYLKANRLYLRRHILAYPDLADTLVRQLTNQQLLDHRDEFQQGKNRKRTHRKMLKPISVNRHSKSLIRALRWAESKNYIHNARSLYTNLVLPEVTAERRTKDDSGYATPEVISALRKEAEKLDHSQDFLDLVFFGLSTGLRPTELRLITVAEIKIKQRVLILTLEGKPAVSRAKYRPREVYLNDAALEIASRRIATMRQRNKVVSLHDRSPLESQPLLQRDDEQWNPHWWANQLKRMKAQNPAIPKDFKLYSTRHTVMTDLTEVIGAQHAADLGGTSEVMINKNYFIGDKEKRQAAMLALAQNRDLS